MQRLANFRIETDTVVWLQFTDGAERRLPRRTLSSHLAPEDVAKVRAAYALRRDFLRQHMPRASVLLLIVAAAVALVGMSSASMRQRAAGMFNHHQTTSAPTQSVKQSQVTPVASPTPTATSAPAPSAPAVSAASTQPAALKLAPSNNQQSQAITQTSGLGGQTLSPVVQPATDLVRGILAPPVQGLGHLLGL